MPLCEGCGNNYSEVEPFCPYCGRYEPDNPKIKLEVDIIRKQTPEDCPKCKNDTHTQKVSSIYASGTSTGTGYTEGSGTSNYYQIYDGKRVGTSRSSSSSSSFSVNQSQLAKYLMPPSPPEKEPASDLGGYIIMALSAIPTCYIVFGLTNLPDTSPFFSTICAGLGLWLFFGFALALLWNYLTRSETTEEEEAFQEEMNEYKRARYVWEHLYYCHKHDIVFMEGQTDHFPVKKTLQACYILGKEIKNFESSDSK